MTCREKYPIFNVYKNAIAFFSLITAAHTHMKNYIVTTATVEEMHNKSNIVTKCVQYYIFLVDIFGWKYEWSNNLLMTLDGAQI